MFRSSESWGPSREVRHIVFSLIPNSCEINHQDLVAHFFAFPAKKVIHLDVSVCDTVLVQVLHPLADLDEDYTSDVPEVVRLVLIA